MCQLTWKLLVHVLHTTGTFQTKGHRLANKQTKKELVSKGRAHGIIVYRDNKPVGRCQYGVKKELPRIDSSTKYPRTVSEEANKLWRITCFFVDRHNRRRGVGRFALNAALDAIRKKGGGSVEAYPSTKTDRDFSLSLRVHTQPE